MRLTVKDPKAHKLAKSLSRRTGKSMTRIVVEALEREDRALKHAASAKARAAKSLKIAGEMRVLLGPDGLERLKNMDDELYDEHGLPK